MEKKKNSDYLATDGEEESNGSEENIEGQMDIYDFPEYLPSKE